jgi:kinesin family member C2/C3
VNIAEIPSTSEDEIYIIRDIQTKQKYEYDRVFGSNSTQEEVFESVQPLCISVLDGYNVCIFAYGQTGSGKTFTMEGYGDAIGVSPRAINELFQQINGSLASEWTYQISMSMLEIYNETIQDLLSPSKEKLDVRQSNEGNVVVGLTDIPVS